MDALSKLTYKLSKGSDSEYYVAVVPINPRGEVLIGERREDGIWTTPAGGADVGEVPEDCAVRECWEEAQLLVNKDFLELLAIKAAPNGKPVYCYLYRTGQMDTSTACDPDREVSEWVWVPSDQLPRALSRKKNQNRLETINQAFMKYHSLNKSKIHRMTARMKLRREGKSSLLQYIESIRKLDEKLADQIYEEVYPGSEMGQDTELGKGKKITMDKEYMKKSDYEYLDFLLKAKKAGIGETRTHADGSKWIKQADGWKRVSEATPAGKGRATKERNTMIREIKEMKGKIAEGENYTAFLEGMTDERLRTFHSKTITDNTKETQLTSEAPSEQETVDKVNNQLKKLGLQDYGSFEYQDDDKQYSLNIDLEGSEHWDGGPTDEVEEKINKLNKFIKDDLKLDLDMDDFDQEGLYQAIFTSAVKKSVVQMGHHTDGGDIETSNVAVDRVHANAEWLEKLYQGMDGFEYGDVPREFMLDKGMLFLSKVDDGLYSGFFKYQRPTLNEATGEDEIMEDTAKIRIEKQTLPTLTQLLMAKEWINPMDTRVDQIESPEGEIESSEMDKMNVAIPVAMSEGAQESMPVEDDKYQALEAKLAEIEDGVESAIESTLPGGPQVDGSLDKKIRVLELVNKLLS